MDEIPDDWQGEDNIAATQAIKASIGNNMHCMMVIIVQYRRERRDGTILLGWTLYEMRLKRSLYFQKQPPNDLNSEKKRCDAGFYCTALRELERQKRFMCVCMRVYNNRLLSMRL